MNSDTKIRSREDFSRGCFVCNVGGRVDIGVWQILLLAHSEGIACLVVNALSRNLAICKILFHGCEEWLDGLGS